MIIVQLLEIRRECAPILDIVLVPHVDDSTRATRDQHGPQRMGDEIEQAFGRSEKNLGQLARMERPNVNAMLAALGRAADQEVARVTEGTLAPWDTIHLVRESVRVIEERRQPRGRTVAEVVIALVVTQHRRRGDTRSRRHCSRDRRGRNRCHAGRLLG